MPEVETVRRGLDQLLAGRSFTAIEVLTPKSFPDGDPMHLIGQSVTAVRRRAKLLMIDLSNQWTLAVHLKMTGQLVFVDEPAGTRYGAGHPNDSLLDRLPDRSTRLVFSLGQARLYFNDQRKFGWVKLLPRQAVEEMAFYRGLGPEPLEPAFSAEDFAIRLKKRPGALVKAALLDQSVVAGIGNIYADEALWQAAVHPLSRVRELDEAALHRLWAGVREVMNLSISLGGSTDRNYVDAEGKRGAYLGFASVFHRQGQPCKRCGTIIVKTKVAGRGSHWCPACQLSPKQAK